MRIQLLVLFYFASLVAFSQDSKSIKILDSSNYYINHGKLMKAIKLLSNLDKTFPKKTNYNDQFKTYRLLGKALYDIGDCNQAALWYEKGLELAKKIKDSLSIADFYTYLAGVNIHGNGNLGKHQLNLAEAIYLKLNNRQRLYFLKYKRGVYYSFANQIDSVNYFFNQVIPEAEKTGNDSMLVSINMNLGVLKGQKGDMEAYRFYTLKSIFLSKKINDRRNLSLNYANYAGYFTEKKQYDSALYYCLSAIKIADEINYIRPKIVAYQNMIEVYKLKHDFKSACNLLERFKVLTDSFSRADKDVASLTMQMNAEFRYKENQTKIDNLLKEKVASEQMVKQRMIIITVIVVLILITIAALILLNRFKIIQKQKSVIESQKHILESKNEIIEEKQKEIIDSINYAKRIQFTLLAHDEFLKDNLQEHFVYFNPKDIVSGDFYWATKKQNKFYLAVCDSTGHGVPGAFMSLLSIGFLSEAINEKNILEPNKVLDYVRQKLVDNISKEGQKDGFDGILICIDSEKNTITYAAANNAPVLVSEDNLHKLASDKMPVGIGERKQDFQLHTINAKKGDLLYLYTDGFADQFGGPKGKKFKYKTLNELLLLNYNKTLLEQKEILEESFKDWRGDIEQVDDVCVIGIRI